MEIEVWAKKLRPFVIGRFQFRLFCLGMEHKQEHNQIIQEEIRPTLRQLFLKNFWLSAFTFGGGYAIVAMMRKSFVEKLHWISEDEMLDLTAAAQSAPGAVAVNAAVATGYRLYGWQGVLVSVLGAILPPFLIMLVLTPVYDIFSQFEPVQWLFSGMLAAVTAIIVQTTLDLLMPILKSHSVIKITIFVAGFVLVGFLNLSPIYIVVAAVLIGLICAVPSWRKHV